MTATTFTGLEERALAWPDIATALVVTDAPSCEAAGGLLRDIKTLRAEIAESCDPVVKAAHAAHKQAVAQKKKLESPLAAAEKTIKATMGAYVEEQERLARAEEARLAAEQKAREEEARLAEAAMLEEAGEIEEAEAVLDAPSVAPPPVVQREVPKMAGVSTRETWSAEVTSLMKLVQAVAAGAAPIAALQANMPVLNSMARAQKGALSIDGVKPIRRRGVTASTR